MQSEGPYKHSWSAEHLSCDKYCPACAYAEGRKAKLLRSAYVDDLKAELLRRAYAEGRKSMEKDFQERLELAEALRGDIDFISTSTMNFDAWKKARGIE